MKEPFISLADVEQGHGGTSIIRGLDLELGEGVFGLLGPNGAGKTTLIRTAATLTPPRRGKLHLLGTSVESEKDARSVRPRLGYLAQSFGYPKNFTATDFVLYCLWLRGEDNPDPRAVEHSLALTGMEGDARTKMKNLSGGMRQRVGIASAVAGAPEIILLDEPTVGLDPAQRLQFRKLITSLGARSCIVLSTHLIEDVAAACDAVAVMADGVIRFTGAPDDLATLATRDAPGDTPVEKGYMSVLDDAGGW